MIAIKNLKEMPKSCCECPFFINYCCQPNDQMHFNGYCKALSRAIQCAAHSMRYYNCPLAEVKPDCDMDILDEIL